MNNAQSKVCTSVTDPGNIKVL